MTVVTTEIRVSAQPKGGMVDVTTRVQEAVRSAGFKDGTVIVFVPGSTGAVSTIEYEPGLAEDLPRMLDAIAPYGATYAHQAVWGCDNGASHLRATLIGPSLAVPFTNGKLMLGTWQQIVFIEMDTRHRTRTLICQIIGE